MRFIKVAAVGEGGGKDVYINADKVCLVVGQTDVTCNVFTDGGTPNYVCINRSAGAFVEMCGPDSVICE